MESCHPSTIKAIHYETNKPVFVTIRKGLIKEIQELESVEHDMPYIGPGLIDLQVNGFKGVDFNTPPIKVEDIHQVVQELWKYGVTTFYPTVITNYNEKINDALAGINIARNSVETVKTEIGGIHLEGPFISNEDGPRGAHRLNLVQPPNWSIFKKWQEISEGMIKIITLSPEWSESVDFIRKCDHSGVVVSIGHTAATTNQIQKAVEAGAKMSTHLGNGAHVTLPRHPNYIWDQLAEDDLSSCIIADGFHLPDAVIKVILKVKGQQAMVVSDSVSFAGMPPGKYDSHIGGKVVLTEEGKLHLNENPNLLAGSVRSILEGVNHLISSKICSLSEAWNLASVNPSHFINPHKKYGLLSGAPADLVVFKLDGDEEIRVLQTYKAGELVCQNIDKQYDKVFTNQY